MWSSNSHLSVDCHKKTLIDAMVKINNVTVDSWTHLFMFNQNVTPDWK